MDWFNDLFIEEAKAALGRPAGNSSGNGLSNGVPYVKTSEVALIEDLFVSSGDYIKVVDKDGSPIEIIPGKKYRVVVDGVGFILTAEDASFSSASQQVTRYCIFDPFDKTMFEIRYEHKCMFGSWRDPEFTIYSYDVEGHTFSLYNLEMEVSPVDIECLPDGYPYKEQNEFEIIPETIFDIVEGEVLQDTIKFTLDVYSPYKVTFDGVDYMCYGYAFNGGTAIGNRILLSSDGNEDTGEPFLLIYDINRVNGVVSEYTFIYTRESGTHTINVKMFSETIHTMAPEFLPEAVTITAVIGDDGAAFSCNIDFDTAYSMPAALLASRLQFKDPTVDDGYMACAALCKNSTRTLQEHMAMKFEQITVTSDNTFTTVTLHLVWKNNGTIEAITASAS